MDNFFNDNSDIEFFLNKLNLEEIIKLQNHNFLGDLETDYAPESISEAYRNYRAILNSIGDLAANRIALRAKKVDEEGSAFDNGVVTYHPLSKKSMDELIKADAMGFCVSYKYGGLNFPTAIYAMIQEIISRADPCMADFSYSQTVAIWLELFGSEEQKEKYLPLITSGIVDCSSCVTEPHGGSDPGSTCVKANYDEKTGKWMLCGIKRFITNGNAKLHMVLARSEKNTHDGAGLSYFLCEQSPQVKIRRVDRFLGLHGDAQCEMFFDNAPAELLGERGTAASKCLPEQFKHIAIFRSAFTLGIAEAAFREAKKYAQERELFNTKIKNFPMVYSMLYDMRLTLLASRTILYEATKYYDLHRVYEKLILENKDATKLVELEKKHTFYFKLATALSHMTKVFVCEEANKVAYNAVQILGGVGLCQEFNVERHYRNARIGSINCGTSQIHAFCAFGIILDRSLDAFYDEILLLITRDELKQLCSVVSGMKNKLYEAINLVKMSNDNEFNNSVVLDLARMEALIVISYLLIRDSNENESRLCLAQGFIHSGEIEFELYFKRVSNKNSVLLNDHAKIIDF